MCFTAQVCTCSCGARFRNPAICHFTCDTETPVASSATLEFALVASSWSPSVPRRLAQPQRKYESNHELAVRVACGVKLVVHVLPLRVFPGVGDQPMVYSVWPCYSLQLIYHCAVVCSIRQGGGEKINYHSRLDTVGCMHSPFPSSCHVITC